MVRVIYGSESVEYSLKDIQSMTAMEVVIAVTKEDINENIFLARLGRPYKHEQALSEVKLGENDFLRIVRREVETKPEMPQNVNPLELLKDARRMSQMLKSMMPMESEQVHYLMAKYDHYVQKIVKEYPFLKDHPKAYDALCDMMLFRLYYTGTEEAKEKIRQWHLENPAFAIVYHSLVKKIVDTTTATNPMAQMFGLNNAMAAAPPVPAPAAQQPPAITSDMLRNAINMAMGIPVPPAAAAPAPVAPAPVQAQDPQASLLALRVQYGPQFAQLVEFGFTDEAQNLVALRTADGNVDMAIELLLAIRSMD